MSLLNMNKSSLISGIVALALVGCGSGENKAGTQVAAKVNKDEISVHQINGILAKTPNVPPEQAKQAGQQILDKLIEQQLLVQKAMERKLDRDTNTVQAIEAAKREILARAYLEQVGSAATKPTPDEVKDYFGKHPELFSDRRIYSINEIAAANREGLLKEIQQQLAKVKSLVDVAEWLKEQKVPFAANSATKAAEQLPIELLPRLHEMKEGQIGVLPTADRIVIIQLAASRSAPIEEKAATPLIEQFMLNQRRMEMIAQEVKQLREKASIEYVGAYANAAPAPKAVAVAAPAVAALQAPAAGSQTTGAAKASPQPAAAAGQPLFDKGIAGIR